MRDLALALVAASAALDKDGDGAPDHAPKRTLRHNVLSKGRVQALYEMMAFMKFTRGRILLVAGLAALLLAYTLFGFVGVPRLLRSHAVGFVAERYERKLDIGEIRFNPFTLELRVDALSFPDAQGVPLAGFAHLLVNLDASSLVRLAPSFESIELGEPFTNVVIRKDGTLNLADLAKPFATPAGTEPEPGDPVELAIQNLMVTAGRIDFENNARPTVFRTRLTPITFVLRDFNTVGAAGNAYGLRAVSMADERFSWDGTFALTPFSSQGRFSVTNLHAATLWSYLRDALPFEITRGMIDVAGDYEFAARDSDLRLQVKEITAADVALRAPGQAEDVTFAELEVTNTRFDLKRRRADIEKVRLSGAALHARRDAQGRINLLALLGEGDAGDAPLSAPGPAPSGPVAAPWEFSAPSIELAGAAIEVEDAFVKPAATFKLAPVDVTVNGYSNVPGATLQIAARAGIDGAATLGATAEITPATSALSSHLELRDFRLASIQPYLGAYTQMTLSSGTLGAALDLRRTGDGALTIAGHVDVAKLHTVDDALRQEFITWDRLRVSGIHYSSQAARLRIDTIAATAPYARLIIAPDQSINVSHVLSAPAGRAPVQGALASTAASPPRPLRVSIGAVRVTNGAANFADFWIQPNYAVNLQNMNGTILGLSSDPKSRARVRFEGKVDRYAPAKIDGDLNLLSASLYTDLKVSFKGVEMTSVTPYSGRFAGYKIEKGKLSIDVSYLVENRTLQARQKFVIDQLELGERVESPDAVRLPLKLAVALLKDRNGVIDIDLPMTGSLDDPQFRMGPLIWKAFVGLLAKAATAPFTLLGGLFGGGEEMNLIEFDAGDAALDATASERIASLAKALTERPGLELEIPTTYSPELDREAIISRRIDSLLRSRPDASDAALADPARRFELLVAQYLADDGARRTLPPTALALNAQRKRERAPEAYAAANLELAQALALEDGVADRELEQLGLMRARAIQDALLGAGTLDAARVFVMGANPAAPGANRKVRVELRLK
jgi:hypothetical protein